MGTSPAILLGTVRYRNDVATTLPLDVFTQRNFVADFLFDRIKIYWKKYQNRVCALVGGLRVTYTVHRWLFGKRVVDFLLVLIELFFASAHG